MKAKKAINAGPGTSPAWRWMNFLRMSGLKKNVKMEVKTIRPS